jgi:hypothetical protein
MYLKIPYDGGGARCPFAIIKIRCFKKSLKSESVYRRRTDNTMAKRKSTKGQTTIYKTYI